MALLKRVPLGAIVLFAFGSLAFLRSSVAWDILIIALVSGASVAFGRDARERIMLGVLSLVGFVNAFVFAPGVYAVLVLLCAGLMAGIIKSQRGSWLRFAAPLFAFFIAAFDLAYASFQYRSGSVLLFLAFGALAWFAMDMLLSENGIAAPRFAAAMAALGVAEIALLALFLPFGYLAQAFLATATLWLLSRAIEIIELKKPARALLPSVLASGAALWLIVWTSFISSR